MELKVLVNTSDDHEQKGKNLLWLGLVVLVS